MMMFGTAVNRPMQNIEDTAVLLPFDTIYHEKKRRHIGAYLRFFHSKKKDVTARNTPDFENEMIEEWLKKRNRKVARMIKKLGRKQ